MRCGLKDGFKAGSGTVKELRSYGWSSDDGFYPGNQPRKANRLIAGSKRITRRGGAKMLKQETPDASTRREGLTLRHPNIAPAAQNPDRKRFKCTYT